MIFGFCLFHALERYWFSQLVDVYNSSLKAKWIASWAPFTNRNCIKSQHGKVNTCTVKCGMKLLMLAGIKVEPY